MFNVNRIQLLLCATLLIHWTSASPSSRFNARLAQSGRGSMAGEGSSRFAQSGNELPGHASAAAGTVVSSGTTGSGTLAAGTGDVDLAGLASGAATAAGTVVGNAAGSGSAAVSGAGNVAVNLAGSVTAAAAGTGNAVIEEMDDIVTVEDAGEEIETIMVDESVDVAISVSGEDSSVPVTVVDESIPVDTVVEADGCDIFCTREFQPVCGSDGLTYSNKCTLSQAACEGGISIQVVKQGACESDSNEGTQNLFLISGAQLDAINRLLVSHNNIKQAAITKANTVRTEAEKVFFAPFLEALQPLLLGASNPFQGLAGNLAVPAVEPGTVEVESPLEIVPQVNLDALNRFLVDPINAAANAKLNTLNDLGLAAGNIGNILSSNIIDTANAQLNAGVNIINEAANANLNRLNNLGNTAGDIFAPIQEAVQPLVLATGPIQNAFNEPAANLIQDTQISDRKDLGLIQEVIAYVYGAYKDTFGASKYNPKFDEFFSSLSVMDWSVVPVRRIVFEVFDLAKLFFINYTGWFNLFATLVYQGRSIGPYPFRHKDGTIENKKIVTAQVPWGQTSLLAFSTYPIIVIPSLVDIMCRLTAKRLSDCSPENKTRCRPCSGSFCVEKLDKFEICK